MTPLETARLLLAQGTACIPVNRDKRPRFAWSRYTAELPSEDDYRVWFANGSAIALIAGRVQCLDVDTKHADAGLWDRLLQRCEEVGLGPLIERLLIQRTPSGGYHLVWRCDSDLRNVKLAENPRREVLLETRGTGGYFLIHPSPGYRLIQGAWDTLPTLSEEERDDLLAVARSFNEHAAREHRPAISAGTETSPGDDFDARGADSIPALLQRHGWTPADGQGRYWTRPGKEHGISASWNVIPGRFWVFSSSTAFEAQHVYRPWHVFAVLECAGDFSAAAARLSALGYGAPRRGSGADPSHHSPPAAPKAQAASQEQATASPCLPPILALEAEEAQDWPRPPELIAGVLYRGAKGMIAGPSKSRKTFVLADLAVSVAAGVPWLGFATHQVPVLYVNLELQGFAFRDRRRDIAKAKLAEPPRGYPLWSWHLRGYGVSLPLIRATMLDKCRAEGIGLIILDPTYKLNQGGQENAAEDVGRLLNEFEQVGREADASVVFCHHFAKGTAAEKASIDRASGSGVWARDPDAILTFSPHEEEEAMIVEAALRNFRAIAPFVVRWEYPLWVRDLQADPTAHRRPIRSRPAAEPARPAHRPRKVTDQMVSEMAATADQYLSAAAMIRAAAEKWGVDKRTAERRIAAWGRENGLEGGIR